MFGGIGLIATGLILSWLKNPHSMKVSTPVPMSLALLLFSGGFCTNAVCGLKLGKSWGKGGLADADWFDNTANIVFAVAMVGLAARIWSYPFPSVH